MSEQSEDIKIQLAEPAHGQTLRIIETYELCEEDTRASLPGPHIYVLTSTGVRMARLVKRVVE